MEATPGLIAPPTGPTDARLPRTWNTVSGIVVVLAFLTIFACVIGLQAVLLIQANGGFTAYLADIDAGLDAMGGMEIPFSILTVTLIGTGVAMFMSMGLGAAISREVSLSNIGLRLPEQPYWLLVSAGIAIPLSILRVLIVTPLLLLMPQTMVEMEALNDTLLSGVTPVEIVLTVILIGLFAPIYEEFFFRGFIHNWLRNRLRFWPAALISSLIFGIFHFNIIQGVSVIFLALVAAWLYERSESLWSAIILHMVTNTSAIVLAFVADWLMQFLPDVPL